MIGAHPLKWWAQGQQPIALSSGEAELNAAGLGAANLIFFVYVLREIGRSFKGILKTNPSTARGIISRLGVSARTRHIQVRFGFRKRQKTRS